MPSSWCTIWFDQPRKSTQAERSSLMGDLVEVVGRDGDDRRLQLGRRVHQQRPLREPEVRAAGGRQATVEPGLFAHPGDGVGGVVDVGHHRVERAAGSECPPAAPPAGRDSRGPWSAVPTIDPISTPNPYGDRTNTVPFDGPTGARRSA